MAIHDMQAFPCPGSHIIHHSTVHRVRILTPLISGSARQYMALPSHFQKTERNDRCALN